MPSHSSPRGILIGLAFGIMLALFLAPPSRWMLRGQLAAVGFSVPQSAEQQQKEEARAAASLPDDLPVQMAAVPFGGGYAQYLASLRALVPRFRQNPSIYASLLRNQTRDTVRLRNRPEDYLLLGQPVQTDHNPFPPTTAAELATFDTDAAAGERLDPDNAFFPFMRAIGLFAAHRDTEAVDAVLRAGQKTRWEDYVLDDTIGRQRLSEKSYGEQGVFPRLASMAATLLPHYAGLRGVTRVATYKAMLAEQGGQPQRGLAIRRALMHCGDLMRVQSHFYIGSIVGISFSVIALERPGGRPHPKPQPYLSVQQQYSDTSENYIKPYAAYAAKWGHPEDGIRAEAQYAAGKKVKDSFRHGEDRAVFGKPLTHLVISWLVDMGLLTNIVWLLLLGAVGLALSRLPIVRDSLPLTRAAFWGAATALLLTIGIVMVNLNDSQTQVSVFFLFVLLAAAIAIPGFVSLMRGGRLTRQSLATFTRAALGTGLALGALTFVLHWQEQRISDYNCRVGALFGLSGGDSDLGAPQVLGISGLIAMACELAVPLALLLVLSVTGRVRRVPAFAAVAQGFRHWAVPVASVLVLIYGVMALITLTQERSVSQGLQQMLQNEGRYFASLSGIPWPGPVP